MKELTIMAWDTATGATCAAIVRVDTDGGFTILSQFEEEGGQSHSRILPPKIETMLREAGLSIREVDLLAIGRGPGSFTGLRTGLALAKGLAMGADIPLMGISTLEVLAANMIFEEGADRAVPVIDARHKEVFTAMYRDMGGSRNLDLHGIIPPQPVAPQAFCDLIESVAAPGQIMAGGSGLAPLSGHLGETFTLSEYNSPSAVWLARLAAIRFFREGEAALRANPPLPMYIRQPDIRQSGIVL